MGWGEVKKDAAVRQGDMGMGTLPALSTSQLITQRAIEKQAGRALAEAARRYINNGTTANRELLEQAVRNYEESVI